jgi:hypothetical protein
MIINGCAQARLSELSAQAEETVQQLDSLPPDQRQLMDKLRQKVSKLGGTIYIAQQLDMVHIVGIPFL